MTRNDYSGHSLVIGRFQPLHNGHMEVLRKCVEESDHLIIGIGSAQYSHDPDNPFTAGERYKMLSDSLRDEGIAEFSIIPVEDLNRYSVWVTHVVSMVPPFKRVYSNNPMTRRLFEEAGYEVRKLPMYNRNIYSGTEVRRRIAIGEEWRDLVPLAVAKIIDAVDGVGRIRDITEGRPVRPYEAKILGFALDIRHKTMCTAESCTGGLIGAAMTNMAGSSKYFLGGVVTYSNEAKEKILGVKRETMIVHGAVSEETAREMALRAARLFEADYSVAVTGIAGPGGATDAKSVGLVYIAVSDGSRAVVTRNEFRGGRQQVRESTVKEACSLLKDFVEGIL